MNTRQRRLAASRVQRAAVAVPQQAAPPLVVAHGDRVLDHEAARRAADAALAMRADSMPASRAARSAATVRRVFIIGFIGARQRPLPTSDLRHFPIAPPWRSRRNSALPGDGDG